MFYAQQEPFRTDLDKAPDEPKKLPSRLSEAGNAPVLQETIKSHRTRSWHSLLENYAQSAWQPASDICNLCSRNLGCDSSRSQQIDETCSTHRETIDHFHLYNNV
jgi:hypothetical protein